jgi:hypothetical protein
MLFIAFLRFHVLAKLSEAKKCIHKLKKEQKQKKPNEKE